MLTNQTLVSLSQKQALLDTYIMENNHLVNDQKMFKKKIVAFLVELGEYANEERSFKYWSQKAPAELKIQLDEYIDGLHFLLSLGNDLHFDFQNYQFKTINTMNNVDTYLELIKDLNFFAQTPNINLYQQLLNDYLMIAHLCQYSEPVLLEAYQIKNQINFDRQNQNY